MSFIESPRAGSIPALTACPCGGIGRHAGLKILWTEKVRAGSIPAGGTFEYL